MKNYSGTFNTYYQNNAASIYCFKSRRKNSKCSDTIAINHLINNAPVRKVSDERILQQVVGTLEKIVYYCKQYEHIELSIYADIFKPVEYTNVNNEIYHGVEEQRYYSRRKTFSSIEECINYLLFVYTLIYPYNKLSRDTVHRDTSIRYFINLYYNVIETNNGTILQKND